LLTPWTCLSLERWAVSDHFGWAGSSPCCAGQGIFGLAEETWKKCKNRSSGSGESQFDTQITSAGLFWLEKEINVGVRDDPKHQPNEQICRFLQPFGDLRLYCVVLRGIQSQNVQVEQERQFTARIESRANFALCNLAWRAEEIGHFEGSSFSGTNQKTPPPPQKKKKTPKNTLFKKRKQKNGLIQKKLPYSKTRLANTREELAVGAKCSPCEHPAADPWHALRRGFQTVLTDWHPIWCYSGTTALAQFQVGLRLPVLWQVRYRRQNPPPRIDVVDLALRPAMMV